MRIHFLLLPLALVACAPADDAGVDSSADTSARPRSADTVAATATRAGETTGFNVPESVRHDPDLDVYFVSNINGSPTAKDNNGYIARVHPDSTSAFARLVEGGRNGATLHAPKGLAIQGDTIWVADIDVVRGFDRRTGAPVATIDFAGQNPTFLNDVAVGLDGIYVTDSNVSFNADGSISKPGTDRIFRIANRQVSVVAQGDSLGSPNGIAWDEAGTRFVIGSFATAGVLGWRPGDPLPSRLAAGPGQYDGVEVLAGGAIVVTSWADSAVHIVRDGRLGKLVSGVPAPADLGVDARRRLLLVPQFNDGVVSYWKY